MLKTNNTNPLINFLLSWKLGLVLLLLAGLGIRMYDLTDPPLDFHSTRQMLSFHKARGMYYEFRTDANPEKRAFAIQQWKYGAAVEPEILERIVAFTYRYTGVELWVARIYSSLFWVIGGLFIFLLAKELVSINGALVSTAFYLFLPYAVSASRSFQPDSMMIMLIIIFWWAVFRWSKNPTSYGWAALAGLFGGISIFIKLVAAFFVVAAGLGAAFGGQTLRDLVRRPQVYLMSVLGILPGAAYIVYGVWFTGFLGQQFGGRSMPALYLSPAYYLGWIGILNLVMGGIPILLGLLSFYFIRDKGTFRFLSALWAGYLLFGIYFNYHISTHDYYSMILIPIVALSLAPLADYLITSLQQTPFYERTKIIPVLFVIAGLFLVNWNTRAVLKANDYRDEPAKWTEISQTVGKDARLIALTQDYGMRLSYWGWISTVVWQRSGDIYYHENRGAEFQFEKMFAETASNKDYFIITDFDELEKQTLLKDYLYSQYPIAFSGEGYIIFDLQP